MNANRREWSQGHHIDLMVFISVHKVNRACEREGALGHSRPLAVQGLKVNGC